ncbi:hypothetical protein KHV55_002286 [Salmonella enterica]|nr:hypothetical protein [Salmonella enterica]EGG4133621.1 hypothetical protein [Salmonella enterica]EIE1667693.1 hypothetical protein [Salmonella enterica]
MKALCLYKTKIHIVSALYSQYMIYSLYKNMERILFSLVIINLASFVVMNNQYKIYCAGVIIFLYYVYITSSLSKQSRQAGEQAICYLTLLVHGSSVSDVTFSDILQELDKSNSMIPSCLLRGVYIFIMIAAKTAPLTVAKARKELSVYEKLAIWLAGGLPVDDTGIRIKISLNSMNYKIVVNFD